MIDRIRIATRESKLALWQANHLKHLLETAHPGLTAEIVGMTTEGDRNKKSPLSQIGGKGVFVKELEQGLLSGEVEIALHCMKDMPSALPPGLKIATMLEREDPRDAFVSRNFDSLMNLPAGAKIGSSSLRRRLQLQLKRPDLVYEELRGNVDTRLQKLEDGQYDAIILASAGLIRMNLSDRITEEIAPEVSIPSVGQGALGIESRIDDPEVDRILAPLNHQPTLDCVNCEREISIGLGANCNLPIAAHATLDESGEQMSLTAYISDAAGASHIKLHDSFPRGDAIIMAKEMVKNLMAEGADKLIASFPS